MSVARQEMVEQTQSRRWSTDRARWESSRWDGRAFCWETRELVAVEGVTSRGGGWLLGPWRRWIRAVGAANDGRLRKPNSNGLTPARSCGNKFRCDTKRIW